jgi:hypothetical protein
VPHDRPTRGTPSLETGMRSWPTPAARDEKGANAGTGDRAGRQHMDQLPNFVAHQWPSPKASDSKGADPAREESRSGKRHEGDGLATKAATWPSPLTSDANGPREEDGKRSTGLNTKAANWPTPNVPNGGRTSNTTNYREDGSKQQVDLEAISRSSPLALTTSSCGPECSPSHRRLNPLFVEWLMSWPFGWTDCGRPVTGFTRWLQRSRSRLSRIVPASGE